MTHAQHHADGATVTFPLAAIAALVMAAALGLALMLNGLPTPRIGEGASPISIDQAVIDTGRAWEVQREQQSGMGVVSADELEAARDWEMQRKAQSGYSTTQVTPTDPKIR